MKRFLCLLALGLAYGDKLDRTYLPPPGSKYAGGQPGDLQVPLEFPKEPDTTVDSFTPGQNNEGLSVIGGPQTEQGFAPTSGPGYTEQSKDLVPNTPASKPQSNYVGNSYTFPTTTTSYAFTQTTTFPPTENYDTTPSTVGPGFPNDISQNQQSFVNQPSGHGQFFNEQTGQYHPGFVSPEKQIVQGPGFIPASTQIIPGIQNSFSNNNNFIPGRPGYTDIQNINRHQQGFPSSTIYPVPGGSFQPGLVPTHNKGNSNHRGVQPPRQFIQQGLTPSTTAAPGQTYPSPNENIFNRQEANIFGQQPSLASTPSTQQGPTQYIDKYGNIQTVIPGYTTSQPGQQQYGGDLNAIHGTTRPAISSQRGFQPGETKGTIAGFAPSPQQQTAQQEFTGQPGYQTPGEYQVTNIPENGQQGQSQQFSGLHPYLPGQGNQRLQYEQNLSDSGIPKGTATAAGSFRNQPQPSQFGGVNAVYPSTVNLQGFRPGTISQQQLNGQEPKFIGQQRDFPSNVSPERQRINDRLQPNGEQSIFPSVGISQEPTIFGQTDSQNGYNQPQSIGQSFPIPSNVQAGFYQPGQIVNNIRGSNIPGPNALPNNGNILSQPSVGQNYNELNTIPASGLKNNYSVSTTRPTTSFPIDNQQSFSSSTPTPVTIATYGTTPGSIYASSTPSYLGAVTPVIPERPLAESDRNAVILNYENELTPEGYAYSFDTSNGIHADENGTTIDGTKANGSYSYIGDDGKLYSVVYTADENGFRPHGDHLPTPPPIPEGIKRVIEQATKDKEAGISHDGFYDAAKYGHKKYRGQKNQHTAKQEKIINGADIPENSDDVSVNIPSQKGGRKPFLNEYSSTNDDTGYNSKDNVPETDDPVLYSPDRINISRPKPDARGKVKINGDLEEDLITGSDEQFQKYPIKQKSQHSKPFKANSNKPPLSPTRRGKPISSKVKDSNDEKQDNQVIIYDDKKFNINSDEKLPASDERESSNISDKNIGEISRQMKLPGRLSYEEKYKIGQKQKAKRPGYSNMHEKDNAYVLEKSTDNKPSKLSKGPLKMFGTKYNGMDRSSENQKYYEEPSFSDEHKFLVGKPKGTTNIGLTKNRPTIKTYDDETIEETSSFEQHDRPSKGQSSNGPDNKKSSDEETGYEYKPPNNKLMDLEKINMFASRFSDTVTNKQPIMKYSSGDRQTTAQPFITPNVYRDEENSEYEDLSADNISPESPEKFSDKKTSSRTFVTTTTPEDENETTEFSLEDSNEQTEPFIEDDINYDEIQTRADKMGPARRPGYVSQQTTEKPEYDENIPDGEEDPPALDKQVQNKSNRYLPDSGKQAQKEKPGTKYSGMTSRKPYNGYRSSTTPKPFRKSILPGSKRPSQQEGKRIQYATTYKPTDTSSIEEEYTSYTTQPKYTSKSKSRRPVFKLTKDGSFDSTEVPSTNPTSRPTFDYTDNAFTSGSSTIGPEILENSFGRPSSMPSPTSTVTTSDYLTDTPISKVKRPNTVNSTGNYYRKSMLGSVTSPSTLRTPDRLSSGTVTETPDSLDIFRQSGPQNHPSTTYRPNYSITDISEPGSVTVDRFSRPLQIMSGNMQPARQFGYPVTNQGTPSGQQNLYQDARVTSPQPGSPVDRFKPTEPRFGGPVQTSPGTKPAEFGPSLVTTPGYLSPHGQPTEKIIGEDFSGPKQQQKFDPETGYYY